jgi:hypothetical protein
VSIRGDLVGEWGQTQDTLEVLRMEILTPIPDDCVESFHPSMPTNNIPLDLKFGKLLNSPSDLSQFELGFLLLAILFWLIEKP